MSVGIFKNGKYNKVAGNAKDSTAANTTYNNGTSGLQANNVQSAIDELDSTVDTLNSNFDNVLAWTRINSQSVIGSTSVSIPSWAKEVQVSIDVNNEFRYTSIYPITSLEDNSLICVVGSSFYKYGSAEEISYASVNISKPSVNMRNVILNGVDVKSKSYMTIYCR